MIGALHDRVVALELHVIEAVGEPVVVLAYEQMAELGPTSVIRSRTVPDPSP